MLSELTELLERDVDRVVQRGRALRLRRADRALQGSAIGRQRREHLHVVVEGHDGAAVSLSQGAEEADRRFVNGVQLVAHARARVDQHDEIHGDRVGLEELHVLLDAVFEDGEVGRLEPHHVPRLLIEHAHVERNQTCRATECESLAGYGCGGLPNQHTGGKHNERQATKASHETPMCMLQTAFRGHAGWCEKKRRPPANRTRGVFRSALRSGPETPPTCRRGSVRPDARARRSPPRCRAARTRRTGAPTARPLSSPPRNASPTPVGSTMR